LTPYPPRLIEVDLPIRAISAHARREKSIRHGHISTLHIWWARRPLAACRAVLCAALWPDPADEACPPAFREAAALALNGFADQARSDARVAALVKDHWTRWVRTTPASLKGADPACWPDLRYALLDFIADFANWDASTIPAFLETARLLTHVAHLSLSDPAFRILPAPSAALEAQIQSLQAQVEHAPRPLVVDPFAGGGSIPLEALRIGADAFASDLNPVAVLLNKVVLEYIPKYGNARIEMQDADGQPVIFNGLAEAVRYWGNWIKQQAEKELAEFYPKDPDGATPIAYLWARTITCEGPGCGVEVPLMRSLWLAKKGERSVALRLLPDAQAHRVDFEIITRHKGKWYPQTEVAAGSPQSEVTDPDLDGTVRRGSATCPVCGYTTPIKHIRAQLKARRGGTQDARLFCVVTTRSGEQGRIYRLPNKQDLEAVQGAAAELERRKAAHTGPLSLVPDEPTPQGGGSGAGRAFSQRNYGINVFEDFFNARQALGLTAIVKYINTVSFSEEEKTLPIRVCLAMALDKQVDLGNALCVWEPVAQCPRHLFGRQAIGMVWDFAEGVISGDSSGSWAIQIERLFDTLNNIGQNWLIGHVEQASAISHPLPDDSSNCICTDPPYYDAVPYADLSDFFAVWLKRSVGAFYPESFSTSLTPKDDECILDEIKGKDKKYFERTMEFALRESRRVLVPNGIGLVVFAHKSTAGWEAQLQAMINAGWMVTGSWPIDTEMGSRLRAMDSAALASSIHIVCRPREAVTGELLESAGNWRDVLAELPLRIQTWLPRLAAEGVVGADAIFACLGPALEIFSRYSRVEKASGEQVTLKEYLEVVWAEVARQALSMIFEGADASGFEPDARLTAMWLWTLNSAATQADATAVTSQGEMLGEEGSAEDEEAPAKAEGGRYTLEYDAARKIAQGLGAHLERMEALVEVKGDKARLRTVLERAHALFGRAEDEALGRRKPKTSPQMSLFSVLDEAEAQQPGWNDQPTLPPGETSLDQLHQAMLLFASGRGEALKTFLVEQGVGKDQRIWRLAQALSALYPSGSDEKRWVDGVLARKKGLGF